MKINAVNITDYPKVRVIDLQDDKIIINSASQFQKFRS